MSNVSLGEWQERPYGWYSQGYIDDVPVRVRSPQPTLDNREIPALVTFNGLATGAQSMALPAQVATEKFGYTSLTFDYTNTAPERALQRNAEDGLRIVDALSDRALRLMGLSMGGAVETVVAAHSEVPIEAMYLVAPAGYIDAVKDMRYWQILRAFSKEGGDEYIASWLHPRMTPEAWRIIGDSLRNCARRPLAVAAELGELLHETVYDELAEFKRNQPDSRVVLACGKHDKLVPPDLLDESLEQRQALRRGWIDTKLRYKGPHAELARSASLGAMVLAAADIELYQKAA